MNRFDLEAANWDQPRRLERNGAFAKAIRSRLSEKEIPHTDSSGKLRGIEYGCGTGALGLEIRDLFTTLLLVDSSAGMIEQVHKKLDSLSALKEPSSAGLSALQWDLSKNHLKQGSLEDGEVDLVFSSLAFHHIHDTDTVLENVRALLRFGGRLFIIDMDEDGGAWHRHQHEFEGHHGFDRESLAHQVERAGFEVLSVETIHTMTRMVDGAPHEVPLFLLDAIAS